MKNNGEKPQDAKNLLQGRYVGILLVCAILIASGVLYVVAKLNEKTEEIPVAATYQPVTAAPTPAPEKRIYVGKNVFIERMQEFGYSASIEKEAEYTSMAKYNLIGKEEFLSSELILSINDSGGVTSFTFTNPIPPKPKELPKTPVHAEIMIHDQLEFVYDTQYAWMHSCIEKLCMALDFENELTYAQISGFIYAADTAVAEQKENKNAVNDFVCTARCFSKAESKYLEFSFSIEPDAGETVQTN